MASDYDVVVVGAGNAALCAAIAAREQGSSVLMLEKAPDYFRGGNTYFTGGIIRFAYEGIEDIKELIPDMGAEEEASVDAGRYTEDQYYDDLMRVTQGLSDPELAQTLGQPSPSHPALAAREGRAVRPLIWQAGLQGGRPLPLLGWPHRGGCGRWQGPLRPAVRSRGS